MSDETQDIKIDRLERDMAEVKGKIEEFGKHVSECTALKKKDMEDRERREKRLDKYIKWVGGGLIVWLLGVEGREEATTLISTIFGG